MPTGYLSRAYSTRTALRRVPVLVAFGEFARLRGASVPTDLPAHVDDFAAMRVASFRRGRAAAAEVRSGIESRLWHILYRFRIILRHSPIPMITGRPVGRGWPILLLACFRNGLGNILPWSRIRPNLSRSGTMNYFSSFSMTCWCTTRWAGGECAAQGTNRPCSSQCG